jgi:transcriptional regulator with XRE-family HTH domain
VRVSALSKRFGLAIRRKRIAIHLSQEQLAELAHIHPTYIGMVERGTRNPTIEISERIARALKTNLSSLIATAEKSREEGHSVKIPRLRTQRRRSVK